MIFNNVWQNNTFPKIWQEAIIIPIPKPNKDTLLTENYRPIALKYCMGKILEKIINNRLKWLLEIKQIILRNNMDFGNIIQQLTA